MRVTFEYSDRSSAAVEHSAVGSKCLSVTGTRAIGREFSKSVRDGLRALIARTLLPRVRYSTSSGRRQVLYSRVKS